MKPFFELQHIDKTSGTRAGIMHTDHGDIPTPVFMPVGTQATVKALDSADLEMLAPPVILANTYHLYLRPGENLIAQLGGLHQFMNWHHPILTDSGGFQVFSLGSGVKESTQEPLLKIDDDGVTFRSHLDGSEHRFTAESSIEIQHKLGADIIMAFDEPVADSAPEDYKRLAMKRTHAWAARSLEYHRAHKGPHNHQQFLFGIIQGSTSRELREESARFITSLPFDGVALGGETTGFNMEMTRTLLTWLQPLLPENKPRYTMGVGFSPFDLYDTVAGGVDMFDCVAPTRVARNGTLYITPRHHPDFTQDVNPRDFYRINITNARFKNDTSPIDPSCTCHTCKNYTRAYINHLFNAGELTAFRLATLHNVHVMLEFCHRMREAIFEDTFSSLMK